MPKPTHPKVIIREIPPKKVAVIKFSGFFNEANLADKTAELKSMASAKVAHIAITAAFGRIQPDLDIAVFAP